MRKSILRMVRLCLMVCLLTFFVGCDERPIHHAAHDGDLEKIKEIIDREPNQINVQDARDFTPLHLASGKGHIEIVEFLLNHGADIESEINTGETPLMLAARYAGDEKYETMKTLLEHGAKVDHKDMSGRIALHKAAMSSGKEIINLLISYGTDVNARAEHQITPLHQAAMLSNIEAAKALVEHGADIFVKTCYDTTKKSEADKIVLITYMNKTAKEIASTARCAELSRYLRTKEKEKQKEAGEKE